MLKTLLKVGALCAFLGSLTACASGPTNGFVMATPGRDAARVQAGQPDTAAAAQIATAQNPLINGGIMDQRAFRLAEMLNVSCQNQVRPQIAGPVSSTAQGAVANGLLGGGGTGLGSLVFAGTSALQYTGYAAPAYALVGGYNGLTTGSYGADGSIGACTRDFVDDLRGRPDMGYLDGFHVEVVYAGKGSNTPPALNPNWNGWGHGFAFDPSAPIGNDPPPPQGGTRQPQGGGQVDHHDLPPAQGQGGDHH